MERPSNELILVTGGTGFTGSHLCRRLVETGHMVRAIARDLDADSAAALHTWGVEVVQGDVTDRASLDRAMEGVDLVYHIAALYRDASATEQDMWEVNAQGTRNMLEAAEQAGVRRFVHCSTIGVHGSVKNPPADEQASLDPGDPYQTTKLEGEQIAWEFIEAGRLPVAIFRPAGIYGPGDFRFLKLIRSIKNGSFVMIGDGEVLFHMVYIDDLVDGILLCGRCDNAVGNVYILAGEKYVTLNELVQMIGEMVGNQPSSLRIPFQPVYLAGYACEMICKPFGISPPLFRRRVDFFRKSRAFDISKARQELGYDPKVSLETGFSRTIEWYEENGHL